MTTATQHAPRATRETSGEAFRTIGNKGLSAEMRKVLDICLAAQRNGAQDLSGREVQVRYEAYYSQTSGKVVRKDMSSISGRINDLVTAGRLERLPLKRQCSISGESIMPVRVPAMQSRLVY